MWKIFSVPCGSALYKFHRIKIPISYTHVSIPGRTVLRYSPHTGLWSDVQIEGTDVYIRHSKRATLELLDESRRWVEPFDLNSMRSVYAGARCLCEVSNCWVPGSYLYVGGNVIGPSSNSRNIEPENILFTSAFHSMTAILCFLFYR
jgi:hypothetical protein